MSEFGVRGVPGEAEEAGVAGQGGVESAFNASSFYKQERCSVSKS